MTAGNWDGMNWLNPPPVLELTSGALRIATGDQTDFWQRTYYGFRHDNGHFLHRRRDGEFTMETAFTGFYQTLYDQAGLMLRHDENNWMKCGIEYTDGHRHFSTVVTVAGRSDWSAFALPDTDGPVEARVTRLADALFVQYRITELDDWKMARLGYFPPELVSLDVGITACSPQREGFEVTFHRFILTDPLSREIH